MGRVDRCLVAQQVGEPVGRRVLVVHEVVGVLGTEEVRAAGRAVEQGAAREDADVLVAAGGRVELGVVEDEGEVGERVAGGRQHSDAHTSTHLDDVSVRYGGAGEGDVVLAIDEVLGAGPLRESEAAGDVVVVDVGLEDVREAYGVLVEEGQHAVDVALRVDDERDLAVVHEVAAVAEGRGVDHEDGEVGHRRPTSAVRPQEIRARVPSC